MESLGPEILGFPLRYMRAGVLAPNGCIYFAPYQAKQVLCITEEGIVQTLGPENHGDFKYWGGGVLAPNGVVYFYSPFTDLVLSITV